jgi:hypothetical protein
MYHHAAQQYRKKYLCESLLGIMEPVKCHAYNITLDDIVAGVKQEMRHKGFSGSNIY